MTFASPSDRNHNRPSQEDSELTSSSLPDVSHSELGDALTQAFREHERMRETIGAMVSQSATLLEEADRLLSDYPNHPEVAPVDDVARLLFREIVDLVESSEKGEGSDDSSRGSQTPEVLRSREMSWGILEHLSEPFLSSGGHNFDYLTHLKLAITRRTIFLVAEEIAAPLRITPPDPRDFGIDPRSLSLVDCVQRLNGSQEGNDVLLAALDALSIDNQSYVDYTLALVAEVVTSLEGAVKRKSVILKSLEILQEKANSLVGELPDRTNNVSLPPEEKRYAWSQHDHLLYTYFGEKLHTILFERAIQDVLAVKEILPNVPFSVFLSHCKSSSTPESSCSREIWATVLELKDALDGQFSPARLARAITRELLNPRRREVLGSDDADPLTPVGEQESSAPADTLQNASKSLQSLNEREEILRVIKIITARSLTSFLLMLEQVENQPGFMKTDPTDPPTLPTRTSRVAPYLNSAERYLDRALDLICDGTKASIYEPLLYLPHLVDELSFHPLPDDPKTWVEAVAEVWSCFQSRFHEKGVKLPNLVVHFQGEEISSSFYPPNHEEALETLPSESEERRAAYYRTLLNYLPEAVEWAACIGADYRGRLNFLDRDRRASRDCARELQHRIEHFIGESDMTLSSEREALQDFVRGTVNELLDTSYLVDPFPIHTRELFRYLKLRDIRLALIEHYKDGENNPFFRDARALDRERPGSRVEGFVERGMSLHEGIQWAVYALEEEGRRMESDYEAKGTSLRTLEDGLTFTHFFLVVCEEVRMSQQLSSWIEARHDH